MILFLDACALMYRFEGARLFRAATTDLIAPLTAGQAVVDVVVSRLSVLECRVKPWRDGNATLLKAYDDFFAAIHVVALSAEVVDRATEWRVRHGLKASDALQAACALSLSRDALFVTGDVGFARVTSLEVRLIRPMAA